MPFFVFFTEHGIEAALDILESQAASNAASVRCSGCEKNAPPSDVFACKTCTTGEKKVVLVCGVCGMKVHKAHNVVEYDAMANAEDVVSLMRDKRQHNEFVQQQSKMLASIIDNEMDHFAKVR